MTDDPAKSEAAFDPMREAGYAGIKILDRADSGREFILPATRDFSLKLTFSIIWVVLAIFVAGFAFAFTSVTNEIPWPIVRFFLFNHVYYVIGMFGLLDLVLAIVVADMWLRSSRVVATASWLQVVTHWLFIKRSVKIPAASIIEIRLDAATTSGTTVYYDILVLTLGEKPGWLARNFPAKPRPESSFSENDLKSFNSGGKKVRAATRIEGEAEAGWLAAEMRRLVKLDNGVAPISMGP